MPRPAETMPSPSKIPSIKKKEALHPSVAEERMRVEASIKNHTKFFRTFSENEHAVADSILDEAEDAISREEAITPDQVEEWREDLSKIRDELLNLQRLSDQLPEIRAEREAFADTIQKNDETLLRISNVLKLLRGDQAKRAGRDAVAEETVKIKKLRKTIAKQPPANDAIPAAPPSGERLKEVQEVGTEIEFDTEETKKEEEIPPPRGYDPNAFEQETKKRFQVPLEEARRLVPNGDIIWEIVKAKTEGSLPAQLSVLAGTAEYLTPNKIEEANTPTDYVKMLAKYRQGVEMGDDTLRTKSLKRIAKMNIELGIGPTKEIEDLFERKDLIELAMPASIENMDLKAASRILDRGRKENEPSKNAAPLWDLAMEQINALPEKDRQALIDNDAATKYVFALANYNRAARNANYTEAITALGSFMHLNHAFGLDGNAFVASVLERLPAKELKNPFEK